MMFLKAILLAGLASALVAAAPTKPLDEAALLKNGQAAQQLNIQFQTIKETDACENEEKACISGGVAVCRNGTWAVAQGRCSKSQECFALPSVREAGTLVTCTSEKSALSVIEASGATGGIFGTAGGNSTTTTKEKNDDKPADGANDDANPSEGSEITASSTTLSTSTSSVLSTSSQPKQTSVRASVSPVTVTITLTAQPTTFAPVTRTISPEEASSIISSLMAEGATIINTSPSASSAISSVSPIPTTTPVSQSSKSAPTGTSPTTILLTAAPNTTAAASAAPSSGGYDDHGY